MKRAKRGGVFDRVRRVGLTLPNVTEGTAYGSPALQVGGTMFVCIPTNKAAEPDSLVVRLSFTERDLRLAVEPQIYYLKPHYVNYACVLARVPLLDDDALKELLETSWHFVRSTKSSKKATKPKSKGK